MSYFEILLKILPFIIKLLATVAQVMLALATLITAYKGRKKAKEKVNAKSQD